MFHLMEKTYVVFNHMVQNLTFSIMSLPLRKLSFIVPLHEIYASITHKIFSLLLIESWG